MEEIKIKQTEITNTFFSYSESLARVFNCNEIFFENTGGMGIIYINDVYKLLPGKSIYIRSLNNEIDITVYKITIGFGNPTLQGWYKMNEGVTAEIQKDLLADSLVVPPNRMRKSKSFYMNKKRK